MERYGGTARRVAASGMALALCLLSLLLFRGVLSLLQALILPGVLVLLASRQSWKAAALAGIALLLLTFALFTTQTVFVVLYLFMTLALLGYAALTRDQPRRLLLIPYLLLTG